MVCLAFEVDFEEIDCFNERKRQRDEEEEDESDKEGDASCQGDPFVLSERAMSHLGDTYVRVLMFSLDAGLQQMVRERGYRLGWTLGNELGSIWGWSPPVVSQVVLLLYIVLNKV